MLRGNMPVEGDNIGCAMDGATALTLFGSLDVIGLDVRVAGQWATIRGVFSMPEGLYGLGSDPGRGLVFCASALAGENAEMAAIDFMVKTNGKTAKEQAQTWLSASGIGVQGDLYDYADQSALMNLVVSLPVLALAAMILFELSKALIRLTRGFWAEPRALPLVKRCVIAAAFIGVAFLIVKFTPVSGSVPPSYLPALWSDFGFWPSLFTRTFQKYAQSKLSIGLRPDIVRTWLVVISTCFSAASVIMLFKARRYAVITIDKLRGVLL
jgi:hypothetical protein